MPGRQCVERAYQVSNFPVSGADANPPTELLQHVDARSSVRRIHHQMHHSVWLEYAPQSTKACIGIGEMMENPGAHNLIEAHTQFVHLLDGKLVYPKILQIVFFPEILRTPHTSCTAVDARNLSRRPAHCMLDRLRFPATGNEDGLIFSKRAGRPKQVIVRAQPLPILPEQLIFVEVIDWRRIRVAFVEIPDFLRNINHGRKARFALIHEMDSRSSTNGRSTTLFVLSLNGFVRCSGIQCGSCRCQSSAAGAPRDDSVGSSWARTGAIRLSLLCAESETEFARRHSSWPVN